MSESMEQLRARIVRMQIVTDSVPALMAYWTREERCEFANRACLDWFGLDPARMVGTSMKEVLGERLYGLNQPYIAGALRGETQLFERVLTDVSGVDRHTQAAYVPDLRDGAVQGFCVLISDVTERKRAEAVALESRAQLKALLDAVPDHILAMDREGNILFANRTLRFPVDAVLGKPVAEFFPEPARQLVQQALQRAFDEGAVSTFETSVPFADSRAYFQCQVSPVVREGQAESALLVSRNVTERKRIELQLSAAERLAAVGTLAAGVAHEINTPIQFVSDSVQFVHESSVGLLSVLEKLLALQRAIEDREQSRALAREAAERIEEADLEYLLENIPRAIERSQQGLKRVADIVSSLKAFSHPDSKRMVDAHLEQVLDSTLTLAAHEYKYVAEIVREYGELPPVACHVNGISQVILNLLVNAAHAIEDKIAGTSERGRITLRTWREGEHALIAIQDTGSGIPEAVRKRVFDPFFTTKPVGKGTGQGLAISWTIVTEEHRGQLWFETESGVGTTFFIRIPIEGALAARDSRLSIP